MQRFAAAWAGRPGPRRRIEQVLVHRPARAGVVSRAVAPGVQALPWQEFVTRGLACGPPPNTASNGVRRVAEFLQEHREWVLCRATRPMAGGDA